MNAEYQHDKKSGGSDIRYRKEGFRSEALSRKQRNLKGEKQYIKGDHSRRVIQKSDLSEEGETQRQPQKGTVGEGDKAREGGRKLLFGMDQPVDDKA